MNNKNNYLGTTILVSIICLVLGFGFCFTLISLFPNQFGKTISTIQKEVTVNDNGISDGIDNIYNAVVVIENYQLSKLYSIGSGFVYDNEGYIITNNHVIEGATEIKVILSNEETVVAELVGADEYADIAVLKIDKNDVIDVAKIGNNNKMKVGDTVFAIGSPVSREYAGTVTRGILSGKNRMVEVSVDNKNSSDWIMNVMQTDAAINPGNSGGPLCNASGEVIGVNNMKIVQSSIEGIGFAIPIEDALKWAEIIRSGEEIKRAYLGIQMTDISSMSSYSLRQEGIEIPDNITSGVIVINPEKDGPADDAGIKKGDIIIKIEDNEISNVAELRYYLYKYNPGDTITLKVNRNSKEKTIKIKLGEK